MLSWVTLLAPRRFWRNSGWKNCSHTIWFCPQQVGNMPGKQKNGTHRLSNPPSAKHLWKAGSPTFWNSHFLPLKIGGRGLQRKLVFQPMCRRIQVFYIWTLTMPQFKWIVSYFHSLTFSIQWFEDSSRFHVLPQLASNLCLHVPLIRQTT